MLGERCDEEMKKRIEIKMKINKLILIKCRRTLFTRINVICFYVKFGSIFDNVFS